MSVPNDFISFLSIFRICYFTISLSKSHMNKAVFAQLTAVVTRCPDRSLTLARRGSRVARTAAPKPQCRPPPHAGQAPHPLTPPSQPGTISVTCPGSGSWPNSFRHSRVPAAYQTPSAPPAPLRMLWYTLELGNLKTRKLKNWKTQIQNFEIILEFKKLKNLETKTLRSLKTLELKNQKIKKKRKGVVSTFSQQ